MASTAEKNPTPAVDNGTKKALISGSTLSAGVVLVGALLVFANYFGWKYHQRFDWTKSQLYTLSEKSTQVVKGLTKDVDVVVFLRPGSAVYEQVKELLARYAAASPRIKVREIDPEKNLIEAQTLVDKYQVSSLNVVVFDSGDDRRVLEENDLAEYDYSGMQYGQGPTMTGFKGEQRFTSALIELSESAKPKVVFTTGHGERSIDDQNDEGFGVAKEILGRDNFTLEAWPSLGKNEVPTGTNLLVIAGATLGFTEPELQVLGRYVDSGGRLLVLLDPSLASGGGGLAQTGLEPWLATYGVAVGQNIVVDPSNPLPFFGPSTIFVQGFGAHPVTKSLADTGSPAILAMARSVAVQGGEPGLERVELLQTSAEGWGETDLANLEGGVAKDPSDVQGPVSLAVAVSGSGKTTTASIDAEGAETDGSAGEEPGADSAVGRIVVFGDSDFASNGQIRNAGNAMLLANTFNWLVERESLIGIPPKAPEQLRLTLTSGQLSTIYGLILLVLPALAITLGILVWLRRRR